METKKELRTSGVAVERAGSDAGQTLKPRSLAGLGWGEELKVGFVKVMFEASRGPVLRGAVDTLGPALSVV